MIWHQQEIQGVFTSLSSSDKGLTSSAVQQKLEEFGYNVLPEKKKKSILILFLSQFKDFMILVLIVAAIISGVAGDLTDAIIIVVIVLLNAIVGFIQEYRAEKAMEALKKMATAKSRVIRDGKTTEILSTELVPGDVVVLEAGAVVPADLRLFDVHSLKVEEASLTGESVPVDKNNHPLPQADIPLGDRVNMAYKSTIVTNGRGKGVVIGTGSNTEIGNIAKLLQEEENITPLQKRMNDFGKKLSVIILIICAVLFGVGYLRGEEPLKMLLVAISLAVAAIPEALPALITVALAKGAKRLVQQNVLIRKLPAVETLGSVTYICSDKTGTLTQNKMTVVEVKEADNSNRLHEELTFLEVAMALNNDVKRSAEENFVGDPTEIALVEYVLKNRNEDEYKNLRKQYKRVGELPFDSDRKIMTTAHEYGDKFLVISKGATESISPLLSENNTSFAQEQTHLMAAEGMRVLAFGYRILDALPEPFANENVETQLLYAGLVGMIDPPREEAKAAIDECKTAGIKPVMITGDHKETAAAIARELGILSKDDLALTGTELGKLSAEELDERVENIRVYARVSPEQKLNIVKSLQRKENFVAMTGDGVNDAPSLKTSNIGIAMGITGTDVSKESAHMILLDDNFATIVKAVREGRRIFDNIRKFVKYIMTCNGAEILTIFIAPLVGLPIPLLPIHILWINLVTDGLPGLALSAEKADSNIMQRPPRKTNESLFAQGIGQHIIWVGMFMAAITLGTQAWSIHSQNSHWQTMVFTVLSFAQLAHVMGIRSDWEFIHEKGFFTNKPLIFAVLLTCVLQLGVIYLPFANEVFHTEPLSVTELLACIGIASTVFIAVEIEKSVKRKKHSKLR